MHFTFHADSVAALDEVTRSIQVSHAITFCQDWQNGQQEFSFFTSGSTGTPKKIVLQRAQLEASAKGTIEALQLRDGEKIWICLNTQLIAGTMMLVRGMLLHSEMTIDEPSGDPFKQIGKDHDLTFASFVPMQLQALLKDDASVIAKLNRFTNVLVGGAAINPLLRDKLAALSCRVFHTYGMTETVSHIALCEIGKTDVFTALPGVELKTDDRDCLCIKSPSTNGEWVITNDVVALLNTQQFRISGRADEVVNSGGIKIFPLKVEAALNEALFTLRMDMKDLFVSSLPDPVLGEKLIAVFRSEPFTRHEEEGLLAELRKALPAYEVPKALFYLPHFEETASGKTDKKNTLKMLDSQRF